MQNRYFGDIGDFSKYGMLRVLLRSGLKLGINWYLYPDEKHNRDGKHITYLHRDRHKVELCDPELYSFLKMKNHEIKEGFSEKSIALIENSDMLGDSIYYSKELDLKSYHWKERYNYRNQWHQESIEKMKPAQIVFCDPDNGFEVPSVGIGEKKRGKYIEYGEAKKQFKHGQSLIVYHHGQLWFKKGELNHYVKELCNRIKYSLGENVSICCLRWETTAKRFYFCLMRPEHTRKMKSSIEKLTNQNWGRHFKLITFSEMD